MSARHGPPARLTPDATHIFDGLNIFPTHIAHLQLGTTPKELFQWSPSARQEDLFKLALEWIREDRDLRRIKEKERGRVRGPREDVSGACRSHTMANAQTRDAKTFFEKYDYSH